MLGDEKPSKMKPIMVVRGIQDCFLGFRGVLEHSPYGPDLTLRDYYMFDSLIEELGGHRFDIDPAMKTREPSSFLL